MSTHTKKKRRALWLFTVAAGFVGLIVGTTLSGPVFVDAFDSRHRPTFWDVLIPNLLVILPYGLVPALLALLVGWVIQTKRGIQKT